MAADFERRRWSLHRDDENACVLLKENFTEELTQLPADVDWQIVYDPEQECTFLVDAGRTVDPIWCDDLMDNIAILDEDDGEIWVQCEDVEDLLPYSDFRARHQEKIVNVTVLGRGSPAQVQTFVLDQTVDGCRMLWNVHSLFNEVVSESCRPSTSGPWWQNYRRRLVPLVQPAVVNVEAHVRKAVPTEQANDVDDNPFRIFQAPALSTLALLRCLTRLGKKPWRAGSKNEDMQTCFALFLQGMILTFFSKIPSVEMPVCLDEHTQMIPGLPLRGKNRLRLPIAHGEVDLTGLCAAGDVLPNFDDFMEFVMEIPLEQRHKVPLDVLLFGLDHRKKTMVWLLLQIIFQMANFIDTAILTAIAAKEEQGEIAGDIQDVTGESLVGTTRTYRRGQKRARADAEVVQEPSSFDASLCILQFFFCLRWAFGRCRNLAYHFAFDASTVGMRDRMLGLISAKGRPAAPLPPQALSA